MPSDDPDGIAEPLRIPVTWHEEGSVHELPTLDVAIDEAYSGLAALDFARPTGFIRPHQLSYLRLLGVREHTLIRPDFSFLSQGIQNAITVDVTLAGHNGDLAIRAVKFLVFEPQDPLYRTIDCSFGAEILRRFDHFAFELASSVVAVLEAPDSNCERFASLGHL